MGKSKSEMLICADPYVEFPQAFLKI